MLQLEFADNGLPAAGLQLMSYYEVACRTGCGAVQGESHQNGRALVKDYYLEETYLILMAHSDKVNSRATCLLPPNAMRGYSTFSITCRDPTPANQTIVGVNVKIFTGAKTIFSVVVKIITEAETIFTEAVKIISESKTIFTEAVKIITASKTIFTEVVKIITETMTIFTEAETIFSKAVKIVTEPKTIFTEAV